MFNHVNSMSLKPKTDMGRMRSVSLGHDMELSASPRRWSLRPTRARQEQLVPALFHFHWF
jgi:hypothetical protein